MSGDNLVLVITKVEDPDEIDTRFSKFSPAIDDDDFSGDFADIEAAFGDTKADEIIEESDHPCAGQDSNGYAADPYIKNCQHHMHFAVHGMRGRPHQ